MEIGWGTIWELFRYAILAAVAAGAVCPLVGCFLLVRRAAFHGVALPQFAAAGVALGFAVLPAWIDRVGLAGLDYVEALESPHALKNYLLAFAAAATFGALLLLALLGARKTTETARLAAGFALASALTILFGLASPVGGEFIDSLLHGEILAIGRHELEVLLGAYLMVGTLLLVRRHDLLLVSYDPETARVLGKRVRAGEALLLLITGLTVSVGTLIVGPVVLFGLLVLPPLAARGFASSMRSFFLWSAGSGIVAAVGGVWTSFRFDWPLGPAVVVAAGSLLVPGFLAAKLSGE
ncbi:MAG: metal ABC transporter permease [Planctomycetota bacterium]